MEIAIDSEIGPLRRVLVHRPSDEIVRMTQHDLDLMLFDDILAPDETAIEHELMADVLSEAGAEVMLLAPLLRDAIAHAPDDDRRQLVERICEHAGAHGVAPRLLDWDPDALATGLIRGVYWAELPDVSASLPRLRADAKNHRFALPPVPNLMFMRDPCISVYDRVVMGRMATEARSREPSLVAFALRHAPSAGAQLSFDADDSHRGAPYRSLEGGDLLVISPEVVLIGCSLRTTAQTIQRLAEEALFPAHPRLQRVYAVMMPEARSVMHLDTLLTHVDRGLFLGHKPLLEGTDQSQGIGIARLSRDELPTMLEGATVLDVLREELGADTKLIPCGGQDRLHQEREQWTDGANAVAMSPGHVILYARNRHTIRTMAEHGFTEVRLSVVHSVEERRQRIAEGMKHQRAIFSFSGSELSRARGGGRCLTMPLQRDPLT